jgi:hypothetical protein
MPLRFRLFRRFVPSAGIRIQKRKNRLRATGGRPNSPRRLQLPPGLPPGAVSFGWSVGSARTRSSFGCPCLIHARDARLTNRFGSSRLFRISNSSYPYLSHPFRWRKKKIKHVSLGMAILPAGSDNPRISDLSDSGSGMKFNPRVSPVPDP